MSTRLVAGVDFLRVRGDRVCKVDHSLGKACTTMSRSLMEDEALLVRCEDIHRNHPRVRVVVHLNQVLHPPMRPLVPRILASLARVSEAEEVGIIRMEDRVILALPPGAAKPFLGGDDALRSCRISFPPTTVGLSYVRYKKEADEGFFTTKATKEREFELFSDIDELMRLRHENMDDYSELL